MNVQLSALTFSSGNNGKQTIWHVNWKHGGSKKFRCPAKTRKYSKLCNMTKRTALFWYFSAIKRWGGEDIFSTKWAENFFWQNFPRMSFDILFPENITSIHSSFLEKKIFFVGPLLLQNITRYITVIFGKLYLKKLLNIEHHRNTFCQKLSLIFRQN